MPPDQFLGSYNASRYHWISDIIESKLLVAFKKSDIWEQNCVWLFNHFNFERNHDVLKSKSPCTLFNKNVNFHENETESKMENSTSSIRETNFVFQKLQQKLAKEKRGNFLYHLFSPKEVFLTFVFYLNV